MPAQAPIVRHFVACVEVAVGPNGRDVTLRNLIHAVIRLPGEPFPCILPEMALYALLTDGRDKHDFAIELTFFDGVVNQLVYRSPSRPVDLGPDPTAVRGMPIPLKNVIFHKPAQYTFYLVCDGKRIAEGLEVR